MKMFKKALAVVLAIVFVLSLAACHSKDEVAVSSGDYKITSAMYSYYLTMADFEAKSLIANDTSYNTQDSNFDLYKQKIDGKLYEEYVKSKALEACYNHLVLEKLCAEGKVTLTAEEKSSVESYAEYSWEYSYVDNSGTIPIGLVLSENGVSIDTFKKISVANELYGKYFEYLYGKDGAKAVAADDIKEALNDNYSAVYMIKHSYSDVEEPNVEEIAKSLDKYVQALKDGKKFADVEAEYKKDNENKDDSSSTTSSGNSSTTSSDNSSTTSSDNSSTTSSDNSSTTSSDASSADEEKEDLPKDTSIQILTKYEDTYTYYPSGNSKIATKFDKYDDVAKLKADEVALIHNEDAKEYYIIVKKDINEDGYYLEKLNLELIYLLKSDEYDKFLDETIKKTEFKVENYAVNQFKVKKIYDGSDLM